MARKWLRTGLALVVGIAGYLTGAGTSYAEEPVPDETLKAIETPFNDQLNDVLLKTDALQARFADVLGGVQVEGQEVVVWIDRNATRVAELRAEVSSLEREYPSVGFQIRDAAFSLSAAEEAVQRIQAAGLSDAGVEIAWTVVDPGAGQIRALSETPIPNDVKTSWKLPVSGGRSVPVVLAFEGVDVVPEGRTSGGTPWYGASTLNGTRISDGAILTCTAGFTWKKWGNGELMGSTAEHCYTGTGGVGVGSCANSWGDSTWENDGRVFGTRYYCDKDVDAFLMRARSGHTYTNRIWIGPVLTSNYRVVVNSRNAPTVGQSLAVSGTTTGTSTAVVDELRVDTGGRIQVLMDSHPTAGGDSGGPWFTSYTSADAIAVGQHIGACKKLYPGNIWGWPSCFWAAGSISSELGASIYTG